jgi:16S rRNA (adenine1518-N6/adenine1519-N6)-dimethyltransferase
VPARLGQHFLVDPGARDAIVSAVDIAPGEKVLEIGPGKGFLTEELLAAGANLTAVEMDERLAERVKEKWESEPRLRLITKDFLKLDLAELGAGPFKIAANLPYAVATPILQKILPWSGWSRAVLMFQKEVADRITAAPGGPDFGLLTLSAAIYAETDPIVEVPRESFAPRPKVASAVVRFVRREVPLVSPEKQELFFKIARAAFTQRRKMAANPLAALLGVSKGKIVEAFERCGVPADARAETIPFEAWLRLPAELAL